MNSNQLATLLIQRTILKAPVEFLSQYQNEQKPNCSHWTDAPCALVQSMTEEQRKVLLTLVQWAVMEAVTDVLGVIDPMSSSDESGDLNIIDVESGEQLRFLQDEFMRECGKIGFT